jgi:hypothetical protein
VDQQHQVLLLQVVTAVQVAEVLAETEVQQERQIQVVVAVAQAQLHQKYLALVEKVL